MAMLKESASVKIQKVFRGFVVRKSVKKIVSIRNEVSGIERRIDDVEVVDLIRRDAKERLRVNETLMSLLFKLDSIRGVDCGVRDLRKTVTKKAIALQEKVDSIAQSVNQTIDSPNHDSNARTNTSDQINLEEIEDDEDDSVVKEVVEEDVKNINPVNDDADVIGETEAMEATPSVNSTEVGGDDDAATDVQKQKEGKCGNDAMETSTAVNLTEDEDLKKQNYENKGNREILESLVDDNEKMMKLMSQISERNEMQTRMINSLSRRVEQLEKALATTQKQRTKKKTRVSLRRMRDQDSLCI
ncbi:hypothetical protein QVD17_36603 [Tagetes erecta]|uniref:BAG domain-containing protein n=1 Tax=Tagetes erecta TaxID=13708 RepID=A0AAD8NC04_TARER|nr:hypothetical protein QVD17_36603 [Tagetes erecta]